MTSILARIRAQGGDIVRDGYRFSLRPGRIKPDGVAWIKANIDAVNMPTPVTISAIID